MNKKSLSIILIFLILFLSGCSNSNNKNFIDGVQVRFKKAENDKIKFLDIDWLTEKNDIRNIINNKFGSDYKYKIGYTGGIHLSTDFVNKNAKSDTAYGLDNNDASLSWDFYGEKIKGLSLDYYTKDNGNKCYLYGAEVYIENPSLSGYNNLTSKFNELYDCDYNIKLDYGYEAEYKDINNNRIVVCYFNYDDFISHYLRILYDCGEILDLIENERIKNN